MARNFFHGVRELVYDFHGFDEQTVQELYDVPQLMRYPLWAKEPVAFVNTDELQDNQYSTYHHLMQMAQRVMPWPRTKELVQHGKTGVSYFMHRADPYYCVVEMAESLGYTLVLPVKDLHIVSQVLGGAVPLVNFEDSKQLAC